MWQKSKLFRVGVIGSVIAAICCFTPLLVLLFSVVGLSWLVGYLDYVLFPALALFIGLLIYAAIQANQQPTSSEQTQEESS